MNPQFIEDNLKSIIGNYPNTYTYTKAMAERTFQKNYGKLKCAIVRPSIIMSSYKEPLPGWTDTISAGGGITVGVSIGMMRYV